MKEVIALVILSFFSTTVFCQQKKQVIPARNDVKTVAKSDTTVMHKKDSVTIETPLISCKDLKEFDVFLEDKLRIKNKKLIIVAEYDVIMRWLDQCINQKVKEYYRKK